MKKGFAPILILIVIGAIAVAGYFAYQNYQLNQKVSPIPYTSSPSSTTDPTTNWKTYTNNNLHLSFKYPSSWAVKDATDNTSGAIFVGRAEDIEAFENRKQNTEGAVFPFEILITNVKPTYASDEFEKVSVGEILFSGKNATKYSIELLATNMYGTKGDVLTSIVVPINQGYLELKDYRPSDSPGIFDQILSTFKFIGQAGGLDEALISSYTFNLPTDFTMIKSTNDLVTYGFNNFNNNVEYLFVSRSNSVDLNAASQCKSYPKAGEFCLDNGKNWGQNSDIEDITVDGKTAKSFYVSGGVDTNYHVIQFSQGPVSEIKMYISGGGLDRTFSNILTSFKFKQ